MNLDEIPYDTRKDGRTFALVHERVMWAEIVNVFGELDLSVAGDLQASIGTYTRGGLPLVVDLRYCEYLDSTILRVLVRAVRSAPERVGIIVPESSRIARIFEMTRLDEALRIAHSREELRARYVLD